MVTQLHGVVPRRGINALTRKGTRLRASRWFLTSLLWFLIATSVFAQTPGTKESPQERLAKAEAMFQERCKTAGERIVRTVGNVDGVLLMKIRPKGTNYASQFQLDDPYGHDSTEDEYIKSFLYGRNDNGFLSLPDKAIRRGYYYVEAVGPGDGKRYRYTGRIDEPWKYDSSYSNTYKRFVLDKVPAKGEGPRYGVTYDDISTREEREYWIAGSSLKVIDLELNEIIAERIGYMMDRGQGNRSGGRSPWLLAASHACPKFPINGGSTDQGNQTRNFVEKVLQIKQEK